jgi:hypothetical protein
MTQQLEAFFKSKGIQKKINGISQSDEIQIKETIDGIIRPAFDDLIETINSYKNIKSEILPFKKNANDIIENVEIRVYQGTDSKFAYRPNFSIADTEIFVNGQYCIPHKLYGEFKDYKKTKTSKPLIELSQQDIVDDFTSALIDYAEINK